MSVFNIGTRALQANQIALQTVGNNIANVNTPGYSRQNVVLTTVPGQFSGGGYIGKGVDVQTIHRNFDSFITRQATLASATQSADEARSNKLKQLQDIFAGGKNGVGAAVSDMMNAFSDVASAPTDLTARTVALTRVDETAGRFRAASQALDDLQTGVKQELAQKVQAVNTLAHSIASVNDEIARTHSAGQPANDLLDRRDQLVRELNQHVQTTSIAADDGTIGIFLANSQPLVLGTNVAPLSLVSDDFGDPQKSKLAMARGDQTVVLDENTLGGGEVSGLLRFQNNDLTEGRNLLGRLVVSITQEMNAQHHLGLDLDGKPGGDLFRTPALNAANGNIRTPTPPAYTNSNPLVEITMQVTDASQLVPSEYAIHFSGANTGTITRLSDGRMTPFTQTLPATTLATVDGITFDMPSAAAGTPQVPMVGDRFLVKPFSSAAGSVAREFSAPRQLAVASPIAGAMGTTNKGSLQLVSLTAQSNTVGATPHAAVKLTFVSDTQYTRSDETPPNTTTFTLVPGSTITALNPTADWKLQLTGTPKAGDTFTVVDIKDPAYKLDYKLNGGNASALMALRDKTLFDGAPLTDGYASAISQVGIRTQSAGYAAAVSATIAATLEKDRTAVAGVNLDEEAAKLLQFQQAYQASSKMIQIAQNIFDTLIQGLGR